MKSFEGFQLIMGVFDWYFQTYQILKTVDFAEMETQLPIKHKFFTAEDFRYFMAKTTFPVDKHEDFSCAWQQQAKLPTTTIGKRANSPHFQSFANENENFSKVCQPSAFWSRRFRACLIGNSKPTKF